MEKFLLSIEFRYNGKPDSVGCTFYTKNVTIGVFEDFESAVIEGNKVLEYMETRFDARGNKERFGKNNGPFGSRNTLVTNLGYLKTPFDFFAQITTLKFDDLGKKIDNILKEVK